MEFIIWIREKKGSAWEQQGDELIYRMRQRYRVLLREEVRQTVADPAEVDGELRHLCATLAASSAYAA
jgi:hypothetical protein